MNIIDFKISRKKNCTGAYYELIVYTEDSQRQVLRFSPDLLQSLRFAITLATNRKPDEGEWSVLP